MIGITHEGSFDRIASRIAILGTVASALTLGLAMGASVPMPESERARLYLGAIPIGLLIFGQFLTRDATRPRTRAIRRLVLPALWALLATWLLASWNQDLFVGSVLGSFVAALRLYLAYPLRGAIHGGVRS